MEGKESSFCWELFILRQHQNIQNCKIFLWKKLSSFLWERLWQSIYLWNLSNMINWTSIWLEIIFSFFYRKAFISWLFFLQTFLCNKMFNLLARIQIEIFFCLSTTIFFCLSLSKLLCNLCHKWFYKKHINLSHHHFYQTDGRKNCKTWTKKNIRK